MTRIWSKILSSVREWREEGYPDVTETTKRLLEYWFEEEHLHENGERFEFWDCQREAMETIIYLYEVCEYKSLYEISQGFDTFLSFDPTEDVWPKYCFKMATGSGKTFVMGMALVWQYFNNLYENKENTTNRFLLIAPNLIVMDRLLEGFENGGLFQDFPFFVPEEWEHDFDLQIVKQTSDIPAHSEGVLHITNVQQFYERQDGEPEQPVQGLMEEEGGPKPIEGEEFKSRTNLKEVISRYDNILVFNDEAHHAHVKTEWNNALHDIYGDEERILLQLDFTATAWDIARGQEVQLPHIVYNYPLKRAIEDDIVKQPIIVSTEEAPPSLGDKFVDKYETEIYTAKEYLEERIEDIEKKPVLFVLCDSADHADEVADYFKNDLGYGDKVLLIHTYVRDSKYGDKGDVKKDQLEVAREAARNIDENEYEVVVSVLMLKEGWDVRNVSVILPMRAFGSDILTEQTLGRGLRRMFPHDEDASDELYVVEHPSFRKLWEEKIEQQKLPVEIKTPDKGYKESNRVYVDDDKLQYDMEVPKTKGGIKKIAPNISKLDVSELPSVSFSLEDLEVKEPKAIERELLSGEIRNIKKLQFDFAHSFEEFFAYLAKAILEKTGSSSQFAELLPKVKNYTLNHLFEEKINRDDKEILRKLNKVEVRKKIYEAFVNKLNEIGKVEEDYKIASKYRLKETSSFHTTKEVYPASKTVFNCLPYDSGLEKNFMNYLENCSEVEAFTKIFWRIPLRIAYFLEEEGRKYYLPDFLVKTDENNYIIETKGEKLDRTPEVQAKAKAAETWCKNVSDVSDSDWEYVKVSQDEFEQNKGVSFSQLVRISMD